MSTDGHKIGHSRLNPPPPTSAPPKTGSRARHYLARARKAGSGEERKVEAKVGAPAATVESKVQAKTSAEAKSRKHAQIVVALAKAEAKAVAEVEASPGQKPVALVEARAAAGARPAAGGRADQGMIHVADDAKDGAGLADDADERFVAAVESAAAAVISAAKPELDANTPMRIPATAEEHDYQSVDGYTFDDPVAKIRKLANLPIDELVARHEEEMARMVDDVTSSAAAGAASAATISTANAASVASAFAISDACSVTVTAKDTNIEQCERDQRADTAVAPKPTTPQGAQDMRDCALQDISASANTHCQRSKIEHAAPKIDVEAHKVYASRASDRRDTTTAKRDAKSARGAHLSSKSSEYLHRQQVAHLQAVRQRMAEERTRGFTERQEQWQRLQQSKQWLEEVEETKTEPNSMGSVARGERDWGKYRKAPPMTLVMWQAACAVFPRHSENAAAITPLDGIRQRRAQQAAPGSGSDSEDCAEDARKGQDAAAGVCRTVTSNVSWLQIFAAGLVAIACLLSSLSVAVPTVPGHVRVQGDAAVRAAALHATMDSVASMLVPVPQVSIVLGCVALHGPGSFTERLRSRVIWVWAFLVALSGLADVAWYVRARRFDAHKVQDQHILNLNRLLMVLMIAVKLLVIMLFVKAMPAPWVKLYRRCKHFLPCGNRDGGTHDMVYRALALVWLHGVVGALLLSVALFATLGPVPWFPALQEPAVGVALVPLMFVKSATLFVSTGQAMSHIDVQGCFQPFGCLRCCRKRAHARELRRRQKRGYATPIVLVTRGWVKAVMRAKFFDLIAGLWLATAAVNSIMSLPGALEGIALPIVVIALLSCIVVDVHGLLLAWRVRHICRAMRFGFDIDGDLSLVSSAHLEMPVTHCSDDEVHTKESKQHDDRHHSDGAALWNGVRSDSHRDESRATEVDLGTVDIDLPVESPLHPLPQQDWTWTRMYDEHGRPYVVHSGSGRSVWESELSLEEQDKVVEAAPEVVAPAARNAESGGPVHEGRQKMRILQDRFHIDADDFHEHWQRHPVAVLFEVGVGAVPHVQRLNEHLCTRGFWPVAHGVVAPHTKYYAAARRIHDRTGHTLLAELIFDNLQHTLKATFKWTGRAGDGVKDMISQLELQDLCGSLAAAQNGVRFTRSHDPR